MLETDLYRYTKRYSYEYLCNVCNDDSMEVIDHHPEIIIIAVYLAFYYVEDYYVYKNYCFYTLEDSFNIMNIIANDHTSDFLLESVRYYGFIYNFAFFAAANYLIETTRYE